MPDLILRPAARYERSIGLLLAEELAVNHRLVSWLCGYCFKESLGAIDTCATSTGASAVDRPAHGGGATDVALEVTFTDRRRRRLLIEDRVEAGLRPPHAARSRRRADLADGGGVPTRCVVIARAAYLRSGAGDLQPFHALVSIESIAAELRRQAGDLDGEVARRLAWRADAIDVLRSAKASSPGDSRRVAVTDWFTDRLAVDAPGAVVDRRTPRTTAQGWLHVTLREQVIYKIERGVVQLSVDDVDGVDRGITVAEVRRRLRGRGPDGCAVRPGVDHTGVVIELDVGSMSIDDCVDEHGPTTEHLPTFERAAQAISDLSRWLAATGRSLLADAGGANEPVALRRVGPDQLVAAGRAVADGHPCVLPYVRPA